MGDLTGEAGGGLAGSGLDAEAEGQRCLGEKLAGDCAERWGESRPNGSLDSFGSIESTSVVVTVLGTSGSGSFETTSSTDSVFVSTGSGSGLLSVSMR